MKKLQLTILSIFSIFLIWMVFFMIVSNDLILPNPYQVFLAFIGLFTHLNSLKEMLFTLLRLLLAMTIASVLGITLGIASAFSNKFSTFIQPFITIFRTVPVISIVIILLVLVGFRVTPYVITFLMITPLIYQAMKDGILSIDQDMIDVYLLEDDHLISRIKTLYIPFVAPNLKTAFLQSAGLGIKVLVMAEYLSQTQDSIGFALYLAKANLEFDKVFAWTIVLILLAVLLEAFIVRAKQIKEKFIS